MWNMWRIVNRKRKPRITRYGISAKKCIRGKLKSKFTCTMHGNTCVPAGCALASGSIDLGRLYVTATTSRLVYTRPLSCYAHPLLRNHKKYLRLTMFNYHFSEL